MPQRSDAIVGRERELAAIGELLDAPRTWPRALVIEGAAGAGKTALWTAATAADGGRRVLRARPSGAEAQFAFAALGDLLEGVAEEALGELPGPQRHALEAALLLGSDPAPQAEPRAVGVAVLGVLRRLASAGPVVVAVDDEQWLDGASAAVLAFALRRLDEEPVLTLLARRSAGAEEPLRGIGAALDAARVTRMTPEPLELDAVRRLLEAHLATSWSRPALVRIHEASAGNPLYAIELGRALAREGAQVPAAGPLPVPTTLRGLLSDRLSQLPPATLDVLAIAATVDQPSLAIVKAVAGRDVSADLREAIAEGVIELSATRIRFSHPLLAVVVHAELPAERRREIHRQLAAALDEPEQRAMHLALAAYGPYEPTAAELARAAEHAHGRGASLAAAELAEHARRLTPPGQPAAARERALASADYAFAAGDIRAARAILEGQAATAPSGAPRAQALVRLALLDTYDGELASARERADAALAEGAADPALRVVLHRRLALVLLLLVELPAAEGHAEAALALARDLGQQATIAQARASLAFLRALRGDQGAGEALERTAGGATVAGQATIDDSPTAILGLLQMYGGDLDGARARFEACAADAAERGDESSLAGLLFCRAELECRAGRFTEAAALAEHGLEASAQTGQRLTRAVSLFVKGLAGAHLGHVDEARAAAEEGIAIAARAGHRFAEAQNAWVLGLVELSLGGFGEAAEAYGRILRFEEETGIRHPGVLPVAADAAEALLGAGDVDAAEAVVAQLEELRPGGPLAIAAGRARALVLAARGDRDAAVERLRELVAEGEGRAAGAPFEHARCLLALGQVQRRAKRKAPARAALVAARDGFRACGASRWAELAEADLQRIGGRAPASTGLTPTESRVAALVAGGRSNKEVAAALFVTISTVEAHLSRIYAKLGVRSRAELAARGSGLADGQSVGDSSVSAPPSRP